MVWYLDTTLLTLKNEDCDLESLNKKYAREFSSSALVYGDSSMSSKDGGGSRKLYQMQESGSHVVFW